MYGCRPNVHSGGRAACGPSLSTVGLGGSLLTRTRSLPARDAHQDSDRCDQRCNKQWHGHNAERQKRERRPDRNSDTKRKRRPGEWVRKVNSPAHPTAAAWNDYPWITGTPIDEVPVLRIRPESVNIVASHGCLLCRPTYSELPKCPYIGHPLLR